MTQSTDKQSAVTQATAIADADMPLRPMDWIEGEVIYLDKPRGWTSFDAVKRVRGAIMRRLGVKKFKVGHAGTLDPLATGVMIVCTGRATKLIESLQTGIKEYIATIALGATTPSFDLETEIDATYPTEHITRDAVEEVLRRFHGPISQIPPIILGMQGQRRPRLPNGTPRRRSDTEAQTTGHR